MDTARKSLHSKSYSIWDALAFSTEKHSSESLPMVSIIIPTFNSAPSIAQSIDSIINQDYPNYEIIVVDASSKDRTLEVVKSYKSEQIKTYSVSHFHTFEMFNKGIAFSSGTYLNFLLPGDYYLFEESLKHIMGVAIDTDFPQLVYCGSLVRDGRSEVKLLFRPLNVRFLKQGLQPTTLQSSWMHRSLFSTVGKFNPNYTMRGGLDLFCRFIKAKNLRLAFTTRVLTDNDVRGYKKEQVVTHFIETWSIIRQHFGFLSAVQWLFYQKDLKRLFKLWVHSVKSAFSAK